jgi:hypothetical protein
MSGFNKSDNSLVNGIDARRAEKRGFAAPLSGAARGDATGPLDADDQSPARQIADGGDHIVHDDDFNDSKGG